MSIHEKIPIFPSGIILALFLVGAACGSGGDRRQKTVDDPPSGANQMSSFVFSQALNPVLNADIPGVITGSDIAVDVPMATPVTSLVATFETPGVSVRVGGIEQTSGVTPNDFTGPVVYTIEAENRSTREYTVVVTASYPLTYLKAPNTSPDDVFGCAVAMSGTTIVVGAPYEDGTSTTVINGNDLAEAGHLADAYDSGAAYVFVLDNGGWSFQSYLKAPNGGTEDAFGSAIAIDGDTAVVGAPFEQSTGTTIINGETAPGTNDAGQLCGAAYVFVRRGDAWTHQAYLKAPNLSSWNLFGESVAISGNTVVVGAELESSSSTTIINGANLAGANDDGQYNGAAYVFVRNGSAWTHQAYLKAPNSSGNDRFGYAVGVSGNTIVVGAYYESGSTTTIVNGGPLNGSNTNDAGSFNGAAYVFVRNGTAWSFQSYLKAPNAGEGAEFGAAVAIEGDTIIVGAPQERSTTANVINGNNLGLTDENGLNIGAAYVFVRSGTAWRHQAYLKAPNPSDGDEFGSTVALSGNTVVVGAAKEQSDTGSVIRGNNLTAANDAGSDNGAAYVFIRTGATWAHHAYLKAPNTSSDDMFGWSVAVFGDTVIVGAINEDCTSGEIRSGRDRGMYNDDGSNNGAAYVFRL